MTNLLAKKQSSMNNDLVAPEALGYSKLYLDALAGSPPASGFFLARSLPEVAGQLDRIPYDRELMAEILHDQNTTYQASSRTFANIDRLRDPRAVCVFAGQQAGLYGGPWLTLTKALAVVKAAQLYEEQLKRPVIPMFWIAGDDHDFDEANHTYILCREMDPCRLTYDGPPEKGLPIGEVRLADAEALDAVRALLEETLGETDFTDDLYRLIDRCYTPNDTMVTAFGKLMATLTAEYGLVLFSPVDDRVKRHAIPFFKTILSDREAIRESLTRTNQAIVDAGYHLQVEKSEDASHLFYNLDGRLPVHCQGDDCEVGEQAFTRHELLERIEKHPEKFSPDVMTRPVFQSYLFPVLSQKGGPAEVAYLAQMNPLFGHFGLPAPVHRARPTLTLMEQRFSKILRENDIAFEELTGDVEQIINRVLAKTFPNSLESDFLQLRTVIEKEFEKFSAAVLKFDPVMQRVAQQTHGKIDFTVKGFEKKVFSAHKRHSQDSRDRMYRMYHGLYTNRGLQERSLNFSYFLAKYGMSVVSFVYDRMDCEETRHQLICLSEFTP
ncbi:MAG: bacillithiol biosynthesis cysteine-adding enzyme BshC [candidate division Zixibacteria bacterium]|nr:bacillithiol biosynthesis cysteine-adding enzyme BshC [candidate division Zixibacteria bacterium]